MKTTVEHLAECDTCRRSTLHLTVVVHSGDGRAAGKHGSCTPCAQELAGTDVASQVLEMTRARSVHFRPQVRRESRFGALAR